MAVGLEIEIPVPIDRLLGPDITYIRNRVMNAAGHGPGDTEYNRQKWKIDQRIGNSGRVLYGTLRAAAGGFRIDADHDDRVKTASWPPREGGLDSIIEIVMDPPAETVAQFNATMTNIQVWITTMMAQTHNLTQRWANGLGGGVSVGPLTGPGLPARPKHPNHNLKGSIQANVGIDLREYHSLVKWYTKSGLAKSKRESDPLAQAVYRQGKHDMREAVNLGRTITAGIAATLTPLQRQQMGNLRGLRGWITHMALYIKRGTIAGGLGGSAKNLAPALLKSPPSIAAQYGMTNDEQVYFTNNQVNIVDQILHAVGRGAQVGTALNAVPIFANQAAAVGGSLSDLTNIGGGFVPLAGGPLMNPTGVGPARTGSLAVADPALPSVAAGPGIIGGGANTRGGIVAEFRTIPGYHEGVAAWRQLGLRFFNAATSRNRRSGIAP